jgi:hypothetical protein
MNYAAIIFWILIAWSTTVKPGTVLVLLLSSIPFGGLALVPIEITGGLTILPQSMFAVVLVAKVLVPLVWTESPKLSHAFHFDRLGVLVAFLAVGAAATVIMPRLFVGVVIIPMRLSITSDLLGPTAANFTQTAYVTLSVMTALAVSLIADEAGFPNKLLTGLLAGGILCLATGLIDMAAASTGMESLLQPFRNAGYAFLTNSAPEGAIGVRRVIGFMPEASAFGPICVQFATGITLLRSLYVNARHGILASVVGLGLILMAWLSTSSTAYGGLAILGVVYAWNWIRRATSSNALGRKELMGELLVGVCLAIALLLILIVRANLLDPLFDVLDAVVFKKAETSSFYERAHWNQVAWDTVASTWGLGIGFGSTRTSNWFAAIVSNTGLLGALLMGIFLFQTFRKRLTWRTMITSELLPALKLWLLPSFAMLGVDSAGPDFGLWVGMQVGAIIGIAGLRPGSVLASHGIMNERTTRTQVPRTLKGRGLGGALRSQNGLSKNPPLR